MHGSLEKEEVGKATRALLHLCTNLPTLVSSKLITAHIVTYKRATDQVQTLGRAGGGLAFAEPSRPHPTPDISAICLLLL